MNLRILIMSFIALQSCSSLGHFGPINTAASGSSCGTLGFTLAPNEHIVDEIKQPIVVRAVKGKLTNEEGGWPDNWPFPKLFEIRKIGDSTVIQARADEEGNFEILSVPEGRYCFKATVEGWQSVIGIVIVSKKARQTKMISLVLEIAT
jgi:hypothetical protein